MSKYKLNKKKWADKSTNENKFLFGSEQNYVNKFSKLTFEDFGLYQEDNFLQSPECPCGCGETTTLLLQDEDEVIAFCRTMVMINDCDYCSVFAITRENKMITAIKYDGEVSLFKSKGTIQDYEEAGEIFFEFDLHCFGLIVPDGDGNGYRIVEE